MTAKLKGEESFHFAVNRERRHIKSPVLCLFHSQFKKYNLILCTSENSVSFTSRSCVSSTRYLRQVACKMYPHKMTYLKWRIYLWIIKRCNGEWPSCIIIDRYDPKIILHLIMHLNWKIRTLLVGFYLLVSTFQLTAALSTVDVSNLNKVRTNSGLWSFVVVPSLIFNSLSCWFKGRKETLAFASGITAFSILVAPASALDVTEGEQIFRKNCAACHPNGQNAIIYQKTLEKDALELYLNGGRNEAAVIKQVTYGKNAMPAFGGRLSDEAIEIVAAYVISNSESGWEWTLKSWKSILKIILDLSLGTSRVELANYRRRTYLERRRKGLHWF